ncbi:MAG: hypothetical protein QGG42_14835 [Phycisphaerae bacterium]|jgi:hypothetical protein|nr:hypothetical protein [Phycisphaerae bacterium]
MSNIAIAKIKPAKLGTFFAMLTILYSFALGATFGLFEDDVKGHLKSEAAAVKETVYKGDEAKMKKITDKSWVYFKRAHMHAAGLGAIALAVALLLGVVSSCSFCKFAGSLCLGLGSLGYSVFWMLAALKAPGLGSTGDAKAALVLLAQPAAGLCILGLLFAFLAFFKSMCTSCGSCQD